MTEQERWALIDQYGNLVYTIVLNQLKGTGSREDIDDCVSDVFVTLFEHAEKIPANAGSQKAYISSIAKHTAIDMFRRLTYRQHTTSYIDDDTVKLPAAQDDPEEETAQKLQNQRLWDIIRSLGEPDSSIIIRQYFYEQTAKEIGRALSMTAAAVQKRSVRARKRIRAILEQEERRES